jgi:hypothetical protein
MDVTSADRAELWAEYRVAETELHDALDDALGRGPSPARDRIDNAYADCIRTARRDVLGSLVVGVASDEGGHFDGFIRRPLT